MRVEQLDLFTEFSPAPAPAALNGFYYEQATRKFVSFVLGRRHYEVLASRCRFDQEWKNRIMQERSI